MHTFVGSRLGELDELTLLWSKGLESFRDHVNARAGLLGFSLLIIRYVLSSLYLFSPRFVGSLYESTAVLALRYTTLWCVIRLDGPSNDLLSDSTACFFITAIYYTPRRPPKRLVIRFHILFSSRGFIIRHDGLPHNLRFYFLTLCLLYAFAIFRLRDSTAITTTFDLIFPSPLFPTISLFYEPALWVRCRGQLLVVLPTRPEDQRQIQPDLRGSATDYTTGADWVMGWIYFFTAYFPWIYVMGDERWDTRLASFMYLSFEH